MKGLKEDAIAGWIPRRDLESLWLVMATSYSSSQFLKLDDEQMKSIW